MGMLISFGTFSLVTLIFGFLAAAIIHQLLHKTFRFRAEWNTTLIACTLTAFVCEFALVTSFLVTNNSPGGPLTAIFATALISLIAGTVACRLIIRSKSGRNLPSIGAAALAIALTTPPIFIGLAIHFFTESD